MACVQPQPTSEVQLECWYMDEDTESDQRLPHRREPNEPASVDAIRALGVVSWQLDADEHESDPKLEAIRKVRRSRVHKRRMLRTGPASSVTCALCSSYRVLIVDPQRLPSPACGMLSTRY